MFAAMTTLPAFVQRLKPVFFAALLALTLLGGAAAVATPASAARVPPGYDSLTIACAGLQNHAYDLASQYHDASENRRQDILAELRNTNSTWVAAGCEAAFGNLLFAREKTPQSSNILEVSPAVLNQFQSLADTTDPAPGSLVYAGSQPPTAVRR